MRSVSRFDLFRAAAIVAASRQGLDPDEVIARAGRYVEAMDQQAVAIMVGPPVISSQDGSGTPSPAHRSDPSMPAVMTDGDNADYPAARDVDSKGVAVGDDVVLTTDDPDGAIADRTDNPDGSTRFAGKSNSGVITLTWTAGSLTKVDTLQVKAGDAAEIQVGDPVITPQA